jgi:hypothetical protein
MEINQYPLQSLTFQDDDFYDIDFWTGSGYQTKKILGSTIKAGIAAAVETLYNADGTLTGNRSVDLDGKNLNFSDNVGDSTITHEVNDGSDYTTLVQDISALLLSAISGGYNSFLNCQGANLNMVSSDGGSNLSSMGFQADATVWLKQNGIQTTKIQQEIGQLFIEYNDGIGNIKNFTVDSGGLKINGAYYLPNADGTNGQVIRTNGSGSLSFQSLPAEIQLAASDETTNLTVGTSKVTFRMPHAMTLTAVRASLSTAQDAGDIFTVDINQNGGSILGTKLTIDNNEKTSTTAATPATIVTSALTDDAEITIDIDQVGTALAKGLKITLIGTRA